MNSSGMGIQEEEMSLTRNYKRYCLAKLEQIVIQWKHFTALEA